MAIAKGNARAGFEGERLWQARTLRRNPGRFPFRPGQSGLQRCPRRQDQAHPARCGIHR
ncbi:hypothetical protein D9M73_93560 [compost metagenome]